MDCYNRHYLFLIKNIFFLKFIFKYIDLILHIAQLAPEYPGAQLHVYDVPVT